MAGTRPRGDALGTSEFDVWADLDGSSSLTTRYVRGDQVDQLFARLTSSDANRWYLVDHQGSVRNILDNAAASKDALAYDAFGNIVSESNSAERGRYTWTSRELDVETGLQYNRARYYDATTGRWISQDPMGFDAGDSNLYRYVRNQPGDAADPSGMISLIPSIGIGEIGRINDSLQVNALTIVPLAAPFAGGFGAFAWFNKFQLALPSSEGGWVVQKIKLQLKNMIFATGNDESSQLNKKVFSGLPGNGYFWEFFPVKKGATGPNISGVVSGILSGVKTSLKDAIALHNSKAATPAGNAALKQLNIDFTRATNALANEKKFQSVDDIYWSTATFFGFKRGTFSITATAYYADNLVSDPSLGQPNKRVLDSPPFGATLYPKSKNVWALPVTPLNELLMSAWVSDRHKSASVAHDLTAQISGDDGVTQIQTVP